MNSLLIQNAARLHQSGQLTEAAKLYEDILRADPKHLEARHQLGVVLLGLGRYAEALACFDRVTKEKPGLAFAESNRAVALSGLARHEEALAASDKSLKLDPNFAAAWYQRGVALTALARHQDALQAFDKAIALAPAYTDAHTYRGVALSHLGRHEEALVSHNAALRNRPNDVDILFNRAGAFAALKRYEEAVADTEALLKRQPDRDYARGNLVYYKLQLADWRTLDSDAAKARDALRAGRRSIRPLQSILISDSDEDQLLSAKQWAEPPAATPLWQGENYRHRHPRVAYVSADFHDHAVMRLLAGVFEHHNAARIETVAVSLGPDDRTPMRSRLAAAFTRFLNGRNRSDAELAHQLREMEIDIAVDLNGYTDGARPGIFSRRPAPIQVNYLGYPGTMGAPYYDYILTDGIVAPFEQQQFYSEKLVHLPHCYLPIDSARSLSQNPSSRKGAGLPDGAFVFCAINATHKLTPKIFDIWMRLLSGVESSVLWLSQATPHVMDNLKREAAARGIPSDRLVFAPFTSSNEDHLARLSLADLFLDTQPYNAHASACDAIWAGVPMVTALGKVFAGRVGASILTAAGLPELIASSLSDYETLAFRLARDPAALNTIRAKLAANRASAPLFDTARFTRNLEAAYNTMWEGYCRGQSPTSFKVSDAALSS